MEVLVALALLTALMGSLFFFLRNLLETRLRTLEETARSASAALLIERIEADLMTCLVGDSRAGAGVRGDESSLRILSRAVPVHLAERGRDDGVFLADLTETEYRFDERARVIEGRRRTLAASDEPGASFSLIGERIARVRFRYHNGRAWLDSFDSLSANALPAAVEVAIWFHPWPNEQRDDEEAFDEDFLLGARIDDEEPDRLTFDADRDPFDEDAVLSVEERMTPTPAPDRVRVIVIPDGGGGS